MNIPIRPAHCLKGTLTVPGDKSLSHRALMFSALAQGNATVRGLGPGADVKSTAACLKALGVALEWNGTTCHIYGAGLHGLRVPKAPLDAGNSGTAMRLLLGILAGQSFDTTLMGDESLSRRPMGRVIQPLMQMGARIQAHEGTYAPLKIQGTALKGFSYEMLVASAQVQSALLLAGLYAQGPTTVIEPGPIRDHTERMLSYLGADVKREGPAVTVRPGNALKAKDVEVPGDPSSAAFWLGAAALVAGSTITVKNVCVNSTRTGFVDALQAMGADVRRENERMMCNEPHADLTVSASPLKAVEISGELIPRLIDELPLLAILATQARGTTTVRDAQELRVKETDRIQAVATNLRRMGARVEEREDGWIIPGPQVLQGATLDSFGDHRIAMAFSIAALVAQGATTIQGAQWADISYPGFFRELERLRA